MPQAVVLAMALLILQTATGDPPLIPSPPPTCKRTCGGVPVPYPFGLDDDAGACHLPDGDTRLFRLICDEQSGETPRLLSNIKWENPPDTRKTGEFHGYGASFSFDKNIEVIDIDVGSGHLRGLLPMAYDCYNSSGSLTNSSAVKVTLTESMAFSSTENVFTVVGCDGVAGFTTEEDNYGGCVAGCSRPENARDGECSGLGCCQAPVLPGAHGFQTFFYSRESRRKGGQYRPPCAFYFMVEKKNYTFRSSDLRSMNIEGRFPVVLEWSVGNRSCEEAKRNRSSYACVASNSDCVNATSGGGYFCRCSQGYQGNPYLADGCKDIIECQHPEKYPCFGICANQEGSYRCTCPNGEHSDDPFKHKCTAKNGSLPTATKLAIGLGGGFLSILLFASFGCLAYQRKKIKNLRKEFFEKYGGEFLQHAISSNRSTFRIFSMHELEKATGEFDKKRIVGTGGYGKVYRGITEDHQEIAVKRSIISNEKMGQEFANELLVLSEVNHKNIVKLVGCCLENKIPMLVYEYIPKGTLFSLIHGTSRRSIPFSTRVRIATETAQALKYLHMDASTPILHGDVKSSNILLDEMYTAKISDFGTSRLAPKDREEFTTLVQGTFGYLDPEYLMYGHLTEKSDVYSFGVVLAELLTRKQPIYFDVVQEEKITLASSFVTNVQDHRLHEILDHDIIEGRVTNEVMKVVDVAVQCLNFQGKERPTMKQVLWDLERIDVHEDYTWEATSINDEDGVSLSEGSPTTLINRFIPQTF